VTLSGRIGQLLTTPPHPSVPAPLKQGLRESAEAYYRDVDWALDIAAAQFKDGSLYMMPGDKIGRDPATQFLLRRKTFEGMDRRDLPAIVAAYAGRFESTPFDRWWPRCPPWARTPSITWPTSRRRARSASLSRSTVDSASERYRGSSTVDA